MLGESERKEPGGKAAEGEPGREKVNGTAEREGRGLGGRGYEGGRRESRGTGAERAVGQGGQAASPWFPAPPDRPASQLLCAGAARLMGGGQTVTDVS